MPPAFSPAAWLTDLKIGLIFLTRLPLSHAGEISGRDLARATRVNPLVGAVIGALGAVAFWLAWALGLPALLCGLLAVAATILLTGAFHEDGLADVADGFGGGWQRAQKLEIMRDSRVGTYGATALILTVALRSAALAALATPELAGPALIAAHALARSALPAVMITTPLARTDGLAAYAAAPSGGQTLTALALAAVIACLALGIGAGLLALLAVGLSSLIMAVFTRLQIGGYTGDVLGTIEQLGEIAVLLLVVALL